MPFNALTLFSRSGPFDFRQERAQGRAHFLFRDLARCFNFILSRHTSASFLARDQRFTSASRRRASIFVSNSSEYTNETGGEVKLHPSDSAQLRAAERLSFSISLRTRLPALVLKYSSLRIASALDR